MDYSEFEEFLNNKIEHAKVIIIGSSVLKRYIYAVKFDFESDSTVIIQGAIHAREHITTDLICRQIQDVSINYNKLKANYSPNIIFIPMVNPDGVELCHSGLKSVKDKKTKKFLLEINKSKDFSLFKANANGVDLNTNFDAKWGSGKENKSYPSSNGFIGKSPMSEPEVQALVYITKEVKPIFTISYHAKGEELYFQFFNKENLKRDRKIAKILARSLKYRVVNTENSSSGGYKDWCVQKLKIPSVTIEVGKDSLSHPIGKESLEQIYKRNKNVVYLLSKIQKEYKNDKARKVYENGNKTSKEGSDT